MQVPCEQTFRTAFYILQRPPSFCQQWSPCKQLVNRPSGLLFVVLQRQQASVSSAHHANTSGLLVTVLQKQLRPDERDRNGQAILTKSMHFNAALNVALCTTGGFIRPKPTMRSMTTNLDCMKHTGKVHCRSFLELFSALRVLTFCIITLWTKMPPKPYLVC